MAISLYESVKLGFVDFWLRKIRSFITLLGIVLGTMSIIVILSIVNGMNEQTLSWMNEAGGMKRISINQNWRYSNPLNLPNFFTMREIEFIRDNIPPVEAFSASIVFWGVQFTNGPNSTRAMSLTGVLPDHEIIAEWTVSEGRFISHHDYMVSNDVVVLGTTLKEQLFGPRNAIGQYVTAQGRRLMVVGIMNHRSMEGNMWSDNPLEYLNRGAFTPLSTLINRLGANEQIQDISIRVLHENDAFIIKPILEDIVLNLRRGQPIFNVDSNIENADEMMKNMKMFRIIFFFISTISLLVGGIVIMNIMLATIQERTREIGIRLAVGARQIDIMIQFLIQTVVVTFIGGVLGVLLALPITGKVGAFIKMTAKLDVSMIFVALSVSVIVGLFFGIYPAIKASKLDPVKALRYE